MRNRPHINIGWVVFWGLFLPDVIFAETITLKSGEEIEGELIEKTDKYIKIDFYGVPIPYYYEDIEKINGELITPPEPEEAVPARDYSGYFLHQSGTFRIVPPSGFSQVMPAEDRVQFNHPGDSSFLSIIFMSAPPEYSDEELFGQFKDDTNRQRAINDLEKNSGEFRIKVTDNRPRTVNGIPAWEFSADGWAQIGPLKMKLIAFFKEGKQFVFTLGAAKDQFGSKAEIFEESLGTFEVMEAVPSQIY